MMMMMMSVLHYITLHCHFYVVLYYVMTYHVIPYYVMSCHCMPMCYSMLNAVLCTILCYVLIAVQCSAVLIATRGYPKSADASLPCLPNEL
jgi:hypothetical protein